MTRYEAQIGKGWKERGMAYVLVTRIRPGGMVDFGVFLVDLWCLGVKDGFSEMDVPEAEARNVVAERLPEDSLEAIHPACAKKLIEGAVAYAEALGFSPHREFRKLRRILSGIDASLCPTEFTFGHDGRPCFVAGPDDTDDRIDRVLGVLEARLGTDGFEFEDHAGGTDEDVAGLRKDLMAWLAAEPHEVPRFYFFSGLVTALHLCPHPVPPTKTFEILWPEGRDWKNQAELEAFTGRLMQYWNYIGERVQDNLAESSKPEDGGVNSGIVDVWETDLPNQKEGEAYDPLPYLASLMEWTGGFWRATEEWPEAWGNILSRRDLAPHWEIIRCWAGYQDEKNRRVVDAAAEEPIPRTLGSSLKAILHALRRP